MQISEAQPHAKPEDAFIHSFAARPLRSIKDSVTTQASDSAIGVQCHVGNIPPGIGRIGEMWRVGQVEDFGPELKLFCDNSAFFGTRQIETSGPTHATRIAANVGAATNAAAPRSRGFSTDEIT